MGDPAFRRIDERVVHDGHLVRFVEATFESPDGERFDRDAIRHPGAVSVVPIDAEGRVVLVRQYRAAIDGHLWEIPAGKRDVADEPPSETAHRELAEEVGLRAGSLELLAEFYNSPGFCDEHSFVFLATELTEVGNDLQGIEEQHMTVERVSLDTALSWIDERRITDAKTVIGLLQAARRLA